MERRAQIGVFGGSGFYKFLDHVEQIKVETPYGSPSDLVALGTIAGKRVAFIPRHGERHQFPPHMIPYKANLWAFKELGVNRVIAPCAAGSLQPYIKPGDFVICDQFVDRTTSRVNTFYDGPVTTHVSTADPYCPELRAIAIKIARQKGLSVHEKGTVVVVEGPRFSTRAESKWFSQMGWHVINMTQYPECVLARELAMCYLNISLITDYDVGLEDDPSITPVSHEEVIRVFQANNDKLKDLIIDIIKQLPEGRENCDCASALEKSRIE